MIAPDAWAEILWPLFGGIALAACAECAFQLLAQRDRITDALFGIRRMAHRTGKRGQ